MKNVGRAQAVATIVSVVAIVGCSSTQPTSIETRSASVSFRTDALAGLYNCYDVVQDTEPDGTPDTFLRFECFPDVVLIPPDIIVQTRVIRAIPWRYSIKITIVPAGGVTEQLVVSSDGALVGSSVEPGDLVDDFESLTEYDPDQPPAPNKLPEGDIYFLNGKQVSSGSPIYLSTIFVDPGIPNILTLPTSFDFNINTGDTVIVRARKQPVVAAPSFLPPDPDIKITASLAVSGVTVTTQGPTVSSGADQAGITFSFTVQ